LVIERVYLLDAGWPIMDDDTRLFLAGVLALPKPSKDVVVDMIREAFEGSMNTEQNNVTHGSTSKRRKLS